LPCDSTGTSILFSRGRKGPTELIAIVVGAAFKAGRTESPTGTRTSRFTIDLDAIAFETLNVFPFAELTEYGVPGHADFCIEITGEMTITARTGPAGLGAEAHA
jgi:hypothetical protein